ncbi:MAG: hypothetical protein SXV54_17160 [Chloroflexota bacterium]|nr:hypothetical protein [Chloroflexota bacterium]
MDKTTRQIEESPIYQGEDEEIAYTLTIPSSWGPSPSSPTVTIKDADGADVTSTYTSGSASVDGTVITTSTILNLVADAQYRLEIQFTSSGNVLEAWADLRGEE